MVAARSAFCFSLRKYSPLLLGVMWFSGGKGVYLRVTRRRRLHFFSFTTVFFFAGLFSFLNLGRKRSQFSFFMLGSYVCSKRNVTTFASSRLIINVLIA